MCPSAAVSKNHLILIIDDARENIQVLGSMLEMEGYEVLVATSGPEALEIARASPPPDLILLDIMMPGMDGFEVCRRLKADPVSRSIPVIFISALDEASQKLQAFRSGALDYITKPFQSEEVVARVRTHLQLATIEELKREIAQRQRAEEALQASRDLAAELSLTEEQERRRITLALQDQVLRKLALGRVKLDQALQKGFITAEAAVSDLQGILDGSMRDLHDLSTCLSSPWLFDLSLKGAIESLGEQFAEEHGFRLVVSGDEAMELREDVRVNLFQMARELLINVVKHAGAAIVTVLITRKEERVCLSIADDGAGFDLPSCRKGFGLAHIRRKVASLGGSLEILTEAGMGTSVMVEIPAQLPLQRSCPWSRNTAG